MQFYVGRRFDAGATSADNSGGFAGFVDMTLVLLADGVVAQVHDSGNMATSLFVPLAVRATSHSWLDSRGCGSSLASGAGTTGWADGACDPDGLWR